MTGEFLRMETLFRSFPLNGKYHLGQGDPAQAGQTRRS